MSHRVTLLSFAVAVLGLLVAINGCATGPLASLARLNPYYTKQWAADEAYMTTMHQKLEQVRDIQRYAAGRSEQEQAPYLETLLASAGDDNTLLRASVIRALGEFRSPRAEPPLHGALSDPTREVRIAACEALGTRGGNAASESLARVLGSDADPDVQLAAARELGRFPGDSRAIQALGLALEKGGPALQYRTMQSLKSVTGEDFGNDARAWQQLVRGETPTYEPPSVVRRVLDTFWH